MVTTNIMFKTMVRQHNKLQTTVAMYKVWQASVQSYWFVVWNSLLHKLQITDK